MEYNDMLKKLYREVKPIQSTGERFEIPKAKGLIEGTKTIITNFSEICSILRRPKEHVSKYLAKGLAALGIIEGERLVLNRKVSSSQINDKIVSYAEEFVICPQCKKPDTELIKEDRLMFIKCLACGAKKSTRTKL